MSELGKRAPEINPEDLVNRVRESENKKEEAWEELYLAENLFHRKFFDATLESSEDRIRLLSLEEEFLSEKRGKNMGERFNLAISDKYLGKIHVVELGRTTNPGANGEVDGLKSQYHDFLKWLKDNGIVENELGRMETPEEMEKRLAKYPDSTPHLENRRNLSARAPVIPDAEDRFAIMVRNRRLIEASLEHDGRRLDIAVSKRMVFGMPLQAVAAINSMHGGFKSDLALTHVEQLLEHAPSAITPIRTAYYLATDIRDK